MANALKLAPSPTSVARHGSGTYAATRGPVVLVVDADAEARETIRATLSPTCRVYPFATTDEVAEVLEFLEPRVVVLSTSGSARACFELARRLREAFGPRRLGVVMLTAPGNTYERIEAIQCGARWCLERPYDPGKLQMVVEKSAEN